MARTGRQSAGHGRRAALLAFFALQAAALFAKPPDAQLSPNPALVGQKVTLSIVLDTSDTSQLAAHVSSLPPEIKLISGPYIQPFVDQGDPFTAKSEISYVIEGTEPGRYVVPPITIFSHGSTTATSPTVAAFGVARGGAITIPLRVQWSVSPSLRADLLYSGETIPLSLVLVNEPGDTSVDSVVLLGNSDGIDRVPLYTAQHLERFGSSVLYTIPAADFELTPLSAGQVTLPAAEVSAGTSRGSAPPITLTVHEAPSAIAATGAIGSFLFRSWIEVHDVKDGREVLVHERVEGEGNLSRLNVPEPTTSGLLSLGATETRSLTAGSGGYSGFREIVSRYLASPRSAEAGAPAASVTVPRFVWFDPSLGRIASVPARTLTVETPPVSAPASAVAAAAPEAQGKQDAAGPGAHAQQESPPPSGVPEPLSAASVRRSFYHSYYTDPTAYLWLLPGPLLLGLFLLLRRPPGGRSAAGAGIALMLLLAASTTADDRLDAGISAYRSHDYKKALTELLSQRSSYPDNAALSYDIALAEYRNGQYGLAIHDLRRAIYLAPLDRSYRSALEWMTSQISVDEQVPPAYPIHPDLYLIALILFLNSGSLLGIVALRRRSGAFAIPAFLCAALVLISAVGLAYTAAKRAQPSAVVVSAGTEMTKIPLDSASKWIELPEGMAVSVRDSVPGYYLVRTALDVSGWVKRKDLLLDAGGQPPGVGR